MTEKQGFMLIGVMFYICAAIYATGKHRNISFLFAEISMNILAVIYFIVSWQS